MLKDLFSSIVKDSKIPTYEFVERKFDDEFVQVATKITSGQYAGVVFSIGNVCFSEEGEQIKLNYQFKIEHAPEGIDVTNINTTVGDIIMDTIEKDIQSDDATEAF